MSDWIKSEGRLIYEPNRGEDFRKQFKAKTLVLELPRKSQIGEFYRWLVLQKYGQNMRLQAPMFGLHVTVVRGDEKPKNLATWKAHEGEIVHFEYNNDIQVDWTFWTLPVRSKRLEAIRTELGFTNLHNYHLTIGRQYEWQPRFAIR